MYIDLFWDTLYCWMTNFFREYQISSDMSFTQVGTETLNCEQPFAPQSLHYYGYPLYNQARPPRRFVLEMTERRRDSCAPMTRSDVMPWRAPDCCTWKLFCGPALPEHMLLPKLCRVNVLWAPGSNDEHDISMFFLRYIDCIDILVRYIP